MYILGINSVYHETAACLLKDGVIVAMAEEERFNRKKHGKESHIDNPAELPVQAISYTLDKAGISPKDVSSVGFSFKPEWRLQNKSFVDKISNDSWGSETGEERFFCELVSIPEKIKNMGFRCNFEWISHHLCHAASAFYVSPFEEAAILTIDGIGEATSTSFGVGKKNTIEIFLEYTYPHSLGFLWEKLAKFLGFTDYDAAKVMGLAAFGRSERYMDAFKSFIQFAPDGTFTVDNALLCFRTEDYTALGDVFGIKKREKGQDLRPEHQDIAASLQMVTNIIVRNMANELYKRTNVSNLCMAGGVALNCTANRVAFQESPFTNLYIQPAANDAGTAIGAAYSIWNKILGNSFRAPMSHPYYGPSFTDAEIEHVLQEHRLVYVHHDNIESVVAHLLCADNIVGWFQGAMELGPRALGNRSLLADARNPNMQEIMNRKVKHREPFRPFAPSVLSEEAEKWFNIEKPTTASDFMLLSYEVREELRHHIPAVVHIDGTSRIQTVSSATNPKYYRLISEFFKLTGVPLVLNTSFNDSEPIVCTPQHAVHTFLNTKIDYLAIGDYLVMGESSSDRSL